MDDPLRIDGTKIMFHPQRVVQLMRATTWDVVRDVFPIYVEVSPVSVCNHSCTFCGIDYVIEAAKDDPASMKILDAVMYEDRIDEMAQLGIKSVMFAGEGEPLLHKHINAMVDATVYSGVDVAFTTNGVLLDKLDNLDRCDWIKVSLNAGTKETYAKVHRTKERDFDKVWDNLRAAVKRKGRCMIGVQMLLLPENQHEAPILQKLCDDAGIDYLVFKPYSQHKFSITKQYDGFTPDIPQAGPRTVVRVESIATKEIPYDRCHATPYLWAYVMSSGDVYSCSAYLLDDRFNLGNLHRSSFGEIWHGDRRRANWELVTKTLDIHECRLNCRMDKTNRYLEELKIGVPGVNFI